MVKDLERDYDFDKQQRISLNLIKDSTDILRHYQETKHKLNILKLRIMELNLINSINTYYGDSYKIKESEKQMNHYHFELIKNDIQTDFYTLDLTNYKESDLVILKQIFACSMIQFIIDITTKLNTEEGTKKFTFNELLSDNLYSLSLEIDKLFLHIKNDNFRVIDLSLFVDNIMLEILRNPNKYFNQYDVDLLVYEDEIFYNHLNE